MCEGEGPPMGESSFKGVKFLSSTVHMHPLLGNRGEGQVGTAAKDGSVKLWVKFNCSWQLSVSL